MAGSTRTYRLSSIDMLRGLAIVMMAIDHSRDFFMSAGELEPAANPDIGAALFFTRWIIGGLLRIPMQVIFAIG